MAKRINKTAAIEKAFRSLSYDEVMTCKAFYNALSGKTVAKASLNAFGNFVSGRGRRLRKEITERTGMKMSSYNLIVRGGKYLNSATAVGERVIAQDTKDTYKNGTLQGSEITTTVKTRSTKKRRLKENEINAVYTFDPSMLAQGKFKGTFEVNTYLDASRFSELLKVRRGEPFDGKIVQFVNGTSNHKRVRKWGAYVFGRFYPGLYTQQVRMNTEHRVLVLRPRYGESPPEKYYFEASVGDRWSQELSLIPFVNCEFIVESVFDKIDTHGNQDFKKAVIRRVHNLLYASYDKLAAKGGKNPYKTEDKVEGYWNK